MTEKELLGGWTRCQLSDIVLEADKIHKHADPESLIEYVDISAINNELNIIGETKSFMLKSAPSRAKQIIKSGDVLFSLVRPYLRNIAAVPDRLNNQIASTGFCVLRPSLAIDSRFLFYLVTNANFINSVSGKQYGVSYPAVKEEQVISQEVCLPPFNEQKRIVAKIEELFSELDNGIAALKTAREQLKVYRQAVLKHAFDGKLTAQWRKDNADKLESPEQLLVRIQQEREARYQQQLEEWKVAVKAWEANGKEGKKPAKPIKPKTLDSVSQEESSNLGDIPNTWCWVRLGDIALIGTGVTPLKSNINFYKDGDIAWVTSGALNDAFIRDPSELVTVRALNETNLRLYPPHTLVVALYGEGKTRGKCSELLIEAATNQAVAAIMLEGISSALRSFVKNFLTKNYEDMRLFSSGGVQPNLNLGIIENMAIPLCVAQEANEISALLDKKVSEIEYLDSEIDEQIAKAETLRQSILKKAFSGQLVPQDPDDEPASELLARIQAEKAVKKAETKAAAKPKAVRKPRAKRSTQSTEATT